MKYGQILKKGFWKNPEKGKPEKEKNWSRRADLNRWPADYESAALPAELRRQKKRSN